jgi:hypothetical protein
MLTLTAYDEFVDQLFTVFKRFTGALSQAGIEYRVIGGMAVLLHVRDRDPMAARLTNDVDVAIRRQDLEAIIRAVEPAGFKYREAAGVHMLVDSSQPSARSAIHFAFIGEKVFARNTLSRYPVCRHP